MRFQINCHNPECMEKNSMVSILYHDNEAKSDKLAFVMCLKCNFTGDKNHLPTKHSLMRVLVICVKYEHEIEGFEAKHWPKCLQCNRAKIEVTEYRKPTRKEAKKILENNPHETLENIIETREIPYKKNKRCITKLYIESERLAIKRKFVGYHCEKCQVLIFKKTTPKMNWKQIDNLVHSFERYTGDNSVTCFKCNPINIKFGLLGAFHTRSADFGKSIEQQKIPRVTKAQIRKIVREELEKYRLIKS